MILPWCPSWPRQSHWGEFSVKGIKIEVKSPREDAFPGSQPGIPRHFWGRRGFRSRLGKFLGQKQTQNPLSIHSGYSEARGLIGNGTVTDLRTLSIQARDFVVELFKDIDHSSGTTSLGNLKPLAFPKSGPTLVQLRLSSDLERWKAAQHAVGNVLPPKGTGLGQASAKALRIFGAEGWPEALTTNNALFGCGIASLLMGAADAPTMFSNYVTDMAFYWEHGYNHVFPSLEPLLWRGLADPRALHTLGGPERRQAVCIGREYIQVKIALEERYKKHLTNLSARLCRRDAQIISLSESSLLGMAAEATTRGFDPGAVMSDLVFSSPGTDVVDVGCDLVNSEVMNSFLNVTDITDTGIVSEDVLRRVYDAYAATGARLLTQRWHEPVARMCALLYTWHIQNDRHMFFRRAILGWPKARKRPARPQLEADFDEVFDEQYRVTGVCRPLDPEYACSGEDSCDHVCNFLNRSREERLLWKLWWSLVIGPLEYVRGGKIDEQRELNLVELSRLLMAELYSRGLVLEMVWLIAHANHHAWQVNYLFEAAMFGSILDGGTLAGKLDREEQS
ncbi:hypothetical protein IMSHALPRED_000707 [Imshaugia aleurites]|uniref:Uncharacterized protein n=1 Tax=Imshaugia aleurites TaxID=172621 RepID=A0A8H3G8P5_9LECA|nr:hypothetical protein IMSHALPRED_000707 [Imshaugia aleurites]